MKRSTVAGLVRLFLIAVLAGPPATAAHAASWQWSGLPDRERVTVTLDRPGEVDVARTGRQTLSLTSRALGVAPARMGGADPAAATLVGGIAPQPGGLRIDTRSPDFGYVVTRPAPDQVVVDIFHHPMGERWSPADGEQTPPPGGPGAPPASARIAEGALSDTPGRNAPTGALVPARGAGQDTPSAQVTGQLGAAARSGDQSGDHTAAQQPPEQQRSFFAVPYSVRARINMGGPADWPEEAAASAPTSGPVPVPSRSEAGPAAAQQTAPTDGAQGEVRQSAAQRPEGPQSAPADAEQAKAKKPSGTSEKMDATSPQAKRAAEEGNATNATLVTYVDEKGNPVPPPPNPADLMEQVRRFMISRDYTKALDLLQTLKSLPDIPGDMREETLYLIADALYARGKDTILENFDAIIAATSEAMNFDLKSHRVPQALLRLGLVNMRIGNSPEAEGYFNLLRRQYPNDENAVLAMYYAGEEAYKRGEYQKAADVFQSIVQDFPESKYVREGSASLARTLHKMGYYKQAQTILDFVDKRWGRFYLEYPQLLIVAADVAEHTGRLEDARSHYWLYYNVTPGADDIDTVLARLGDILAKQKQADAARVIYEEAVRRFPDKDGGLISLMRLAEEGIHDAPSIAEMVTVFQRPDNTRPVQAYTTIISGHPQSPLAPLARLKLTMWYLWNHQYPDALTSAVEFTKTHPDSDMLPKVREIALQSFSLMVAESLSDSNYGRVLALWEQHPLIQEHERELSVDTRVAIALSYANTGQPLRALELLDGFLKGPKDPRHGENTLALALKVYLENQDWQRIADLMRDVSGWTLSDPLRKQADYALALAHENLGHSDLAVPLWQRLYDRKDLPVEQRAYVGYFLSRDAERKRELEKAYLLTRETLSDFLAVAQADPDRADTPRIKESLLSLMDITEAAGRLRESLDWIDQYARYVPDSDPGYAAMRYRVARLQRKMGNVDAWKNTLEELVRLDPQSLYGRMAASELRTTDVTKGLSGFTQGTPQ